MRMAMIDDNNIVYNIIEAEPNFKINGYILLQIDDFEPCQVGDVFNSKTKKFERLIPDLQIIKKKGLAHLD